MAEKVDYAALKKGGFMRQKQKGCFSLRIAVVGGNLTAENIKTVAEVSEKYGHGYVHMTSRQGIEIPFIKVEDINVVKEELAKGGVGTGVCGPRVRTITACQGSEICPSGCIDTYTLAKELDERYFGRELCPLTFVKAKVAIEELDDGEVLAIRMNDGEPVQNVPRSMKEEGHKILKLEDNEDGTYTLYVRKVED